MKTLIMVVALALSWSGAALASNANHSRSFEFFGKRFCFAGASSSMHCDVRLPQTSAKTTNAKAWPRMAKAETQGMRLRLWGNEYCLGAAAGGVGCDHSFPPVAQGMQGKIVSILGFKVCLDEPKGTPGCDMRVPAPETPAQMHARR